MLWYKISIQIIDISFECNIPLVFEEHLQLNQRHGDLIKNANKDIFVWIQQSAVWMVTKFFI